MGRHGHHHHHRHNNDLDLDLDLDPDLDGERRVLLKYVTRLLFVALVTSSLAVLAASLLLLARCRRAVREVEAVLAASASVGTCGALGGPAYLACLVLLVAVFGLGCVGRRVSGALLLLLSAMAAVVGVVLLGTQDCDGDAGAVRAALALRMQHCGFYRPSSSSSSPSSALPNSSGDSSGDAEGESGTAVPVGARRSDVLQHGATTTTTLVGCSDAADSVRILCSKHLAAAEQHLEVSEQHLSATGQHLPASEQHLTATGQHLPASEQHLAASKQHLAATDQHLTATGQHLLASEQHLTGTGQHLPATGEHLSPSGQNAAASGHRRPETAQRLTDTAELQLAASVGQRPLPASGKHAVPATTEEHRPPDPAPPPAPGTERQPLPPALNHSGLELCARRASDALRALCQQDSELSLPLLLTLPVFYAGVGLGLVYLKHADDRRRRQGRRGSSGTGKRAVSSVGTNTARSPSAAASASASASLLEASRRQRRALSACLTALCLTCWLPGNRCCCRCGSCCGSSSAPSFSSSSFSSAGALQMQLMRQGQGAETAAGSSSGRVIVRSHHHSEPDPHEEACLMDECV